MLFVHFLLNSVICTCYSFKHCSTFRSQLPFSDYDANARAIELYCCRAELNYCSGGHLRYLAYLPGPNVEFVDYQNVISSFHGLYSRASCLNLDTTCKARW